MTSPKLPDRAGALVFAVGGAYNVSGCDSEAVFNFTLSLLSDSFQALGVGTRPNFSPKFSHCMYVRKEFFFFW